MTIIKGEFVRHRTKGYIGKVLGTTSIKSLLEERGDTIGHRVKCGGTVHIASERNLELLASFEAEQRHKVNIQARGMVYKGTRKRDLASSAGRHRAAHCWDCHARVDNKIDVECVACGWIICSCGTCGCGYVPKTGNS